MRSVPQRADRPARADRRHDISQKLLAAFEVLLDEGSRFSEVSVDRLAREAGVSRSNFYVYFDDKTALLAELAANFIREMLESLQGWFDLPNDATRADVRDAMGALFDAYRPHRLLMGAVIEAAAYDRRVGDQWARVRADAVGQVIGRIRSGQADGSVDPDVDPDAVGTWLTLMTERGLDRLVTAAEPDEVDHLLTAMTDIYWFTLYASVRRNRS